MGSVEEAQPATAIAPTNTQTDRISVDCTQPAMVHTWKPIFRPFGAGLRANASPAVGLAAIRSESPPQPLLSADRQIREADAEGVPRALAQGVSPGTEAN